MAQNFVSEQQVKILDELSELLKKEDITKEE